MRTLIARACLVGSILFAGGLAAPGEEAKRPFSLSKETTYFTAPVRADGTIDYAEAVNARLAAGLTRENNAAIPLLEAMTEAAVGRVEHYNKVRAKLGLAALPVVKDGAEGPGVPGFNGPEPAKFDQTQHGPWAADKAPEAAKWLESMDARLNLLVDASRRDHYHMPLVRERERDFMVLVLLPHLGETRTLATALEARALLALGKEDGAAFRRDAVAIIRLGRLMTHSSTVIEWLVAANVEGMGLDAVSTAASGGWLSAAEAKAIAADLRAAPADVSMAEVFDVNERTFPLEILQACAVHGAGELARALEGTQLNIPAPADLASKDWDAAMRTVNTWHERSSAVRRKPTYAARIAATDELEADLAKLAAKTGRGGQPVAGAAIEERLVVEMLASLGRAGVVETRLRVDRDLADVALALSAFRAASGEYPGDLAELRPAYLKAVPVDGFTDRALVYHPEGGGYVLKSLGPNGRDDTGIVGAANDDRVVRAER
jgi:hypothetical protein